MAETPQASGADLARQALSRARAAAKTAPTQKQRTPRRVRREMGGGRDPRPLGAIVDGLAAVEGWADSLGGGNILDRWRELCPAVYADTTRPTGYDPDTGTLTLRAASHTVATGLRMAERMLVQTVNAKVGRIVVRKIRVIIGTDAAGPRQVEDQRPEESHAATPEAPIRTREDGCAGYQDARAVVLEHRPERPPVNPYVEEAMRRQEAALRAGRQAETEHRDAEWAQETTGPAVGSVEESLARARAYARQTRSGRAPRRAFDVA